MNEKLIRTYIMTILNEMSYDDVKMSKDPLDWVTAAYHEPEAWNVDDPYIAMALAAKKAGLKPIGSPGSSRIVFEFDGSKVVKLARNNRGIEQNKLEAFAGKDPFMHKILAGVHDYSDEFAWIVSDKLRPLEDTDAATAEKFIGISWNEVREHLGVKASDAFAATVGQLGQKNKTQLKTAGSRSGDKLSGKTFLSYLDEFTSRYQDMLPGDLAKLSSWGVTPDGRLVLLDYGITRKKFIELYR